jgi:hypothetical protein
MQCVGPNSGLYTKIPIARIETLDMNGQIMICKGLIFCTELNAIYGQKTPFAEDQMPPTKIDRFNTKRMNQSGKTIARLPSMMARSWTW